MRRNPRGYLQPFLSARQLLEKFPEVNDIASIDIVQVVNLDSTNIQPHHWTETAKAIFERHDACDGFVVTHGTDTMVYSAAAISFL